MKTASLTITECDAIKAYIANIWPANPNNGSVLKGKNHACRSRLWEMAGNSHDMAWLRAALREHITVVSISRGRGYGGNVEFVPAALAAAIRNIRTEIQHSTGKLLPALSAAIGETHAVVCCTAIVLTS